MLPVEADRLTLRHWREVAEFSSNWSKTVFGGFELKNLVSQPSKLDGFGQLSPSPTRPRDSRLEIPKTVKVFLRCTNRDEFRRSAL